MYLHTSSGPSGLFDTCDWQHLIKCCTKEDVKNHNPSEPSDTHSMLHSVDTT